MWHIYHWKFLVDCSFQKKNFEILPCWGCFGPFKGPIRSIGGPKPNFYPYASSYNHIFIQNTSKLHFLYPARLVGYEYVEENVEKFSTYSYPTSLVGYKKCNFVAFW